MPGARATDRLVPPTGRSLVSWGWDFGEVAHDFKEQQVHWRGGNGGPFEFFLLRDLIF